MKPTPRSGWKLIFTLALLVMTALLSLSCSKLSDSALEEGLVPDAVSQFYDNKGKVVYTTASAEHRIPVKFEQIPKHVRYAFISIEDNRFYEHGGIDYRGTLRALVSNILGHDVQGGSTITMPIFNLEVSMHPVIYVILAVILIWTSINVTNCTDGVDGLSGTLTIITLFSFFILDQGVEGMDYQIVLFIASLLGYQWFNAKPSLLLMGDAGSRAMGFFIAIVAMKSGHPFMFIPLALIMILDGGLGLVKVSFIRYLKLKNFMANVKTPLHDNVRKLRGWSDTQTVFRFAIMQIVISIMALYLAQ